MAEATPGRFAPLALVQHEPIGCSQHDIKALQVRDTWSVWQRAGWQVRQAYGDVLDSDVACRGGPRRAVGPSALACFRVGTEQIGWGANWLGTRL